MVARVGSGAFRPGLGHGSRLTRVSDRVPISSKELARRAGSHRFGAIATRELEKWLIEERLAQATPSGLVPTPRGLELGGAVEQVAYDLGRGR